MSTSVSGSTSDSQMDCLKLLAGESSPKWITFCANLRFNSLSVTFFFRFLNNATLNHLSTTTPLNATIVFLRTLQCYWRMRKPVHRTSQTSLYFLKHFFPNVNSVLYCCFSLFYHPTALLYAIIFFTALIPSDIADADLPSILDLNIFATMVRVTYITRNNTK